MTELNLRLSLRRYQAEVFLCGKRFIVLVAGRRWGKTTLALWYLIVNACSSERRICYYVAPTYNQAKRIAWSRLRQLVPKEACRRVSEQDLLVELLNGSIPQLHGANRPDRLRGVGLDCAVMDEFADMKVETWNSVIRPALTNRKGRAMFIGTPRGRNHFYDLYSRAKFRVDWGLFRFSTEQGGYVSRDELEAVACEMDPTEYAREFCASFEDSRVRVYHV